MMGRGKTEDSDLQEGEIPLLDADRLSDHTNAVASQQAETSFGSAEDDRAIAILKERLKKLPSSRNKSSEEVEDQAIELYNLSCRQALSPNCSQEQLGKIASLLKEKPEDLLRRLRQEQGAEDLAGSEKGALGLLRALGR